jgi:hypothetical protein
VTIITELTLSFSASPPRLLVANTHIDQISTKFARHLCARASDEFWGLGYPSTPSRAKIGPGLTRDQTNTKQKPNKQDKANK